MGHRCRRPIDAVCGRLVRIAQGLLHDACIL
jgi:hypothetical protein